MSLRSIAALLGFLGASFGAAAFGSYFTNQSVGSWYQTLDKPSWQPPSAAFGPVWTVLYTFMAIAAWLVWRSDDRSAPSPTARKQALIAWGVQLVINAAWSAVFFGARSPAGGLAVIAGLVPAIATTAALSGRVSKTAGLLLTPYLAWATFAAALNTRIWQLNE